MLRVLNVFLLLAFLTAAISLLLYRFIAWQLQGDESLYQVHAYGGMIFIILAILHLILNFNWIQANYLKRKKGGKK